MVSHVTISIVINRVLFFFLHALLIFQTQSIIPIPFDLAVVNEGNAMNLTSGKFTTSRQGITFTLITLTFWQSSG
jgi:hypothetical protein